MISFVFFLRKKNRRRRFFSFKERTPMRTFLCLIIVFTIFFLFGIILLYPRPIDIVYTWVDYDESMKMEITGQSITPYVSLDELKYSIRSIFLFAPWFHHIYLVVRDGQCPWWLNTEHPNITLVNHSEIIPKEYLPTTNSIVIEAHLHFIPSLSEQYLYLNDDVLLWNPVQSTVFFRNGKTIQTNSTVVSSEYKQPMRIEKNEIICNDNIDAEYEFMKMIGWNASLIQSLWGYDQVSLVHHVPFPNLKSTNRQLDSLLYKLRKNGTSLADLSNQQKKRSNENIARVSIFQKYFYQKKSKTILIEEENVKAQMIELSHLFRNTSQIQSLLYDHDTLFVNIQNNIEYMDKGAKDNGMQDWNLMKSIMDRKFSEKSPVEY